jgi:hypothetical protein
MAMKFGSSGIKTIEGMAKAATMDAAETQNVVSNLNYKKKKTKEFPTNIQGNTLSVAAINPVKLDAPIRLGKRNSFIGGRAMVAKGLNAKQSAAMHHMKSFAKASQQMRKSSEASGGSLLYDSNKSEMDKMIDFLGDLGVSIENPLKKNRKLEKEARRGKNKKAHERGFDAPLLFNNTMNENVMVPLEAIFRPASQIIKSDLAIIDKIHLGEGNVGCRGLDKSHNKAIAYVAGEMGFLYTKLSPMGEFALYASSGKKPGSESDYGFGPRIVPNGTIALLGAAQSHLRRNGDASKHKEDTKRRVGRVSRYRSSKIAAESRRFAANSPDVTAEAQPTAQSVLDLLK